MDNSEITSNNMYIYIHIHRILHEIYIYNIYIYIYITYIAYTKHLTYVYEVYKVLVHYTDTGFNVCCAMTVLEVNKIQTANGCFQK